jgi:hypothetical protein
VFRGCPKVRLRIAPSSLGSLCSLHFSALFLNLLPAFCVRLICVWFSTSVSAFSPLSLYLILHFFPTFFSTFLHPHPLANSPLVPRLISYVILQSFPAFPTLFSAWFPPVSSLVSTRIAYLYFRTQFCFLPLLCLLHTSISMPSRSSA